MRRGFKTEANAIAREVRAELSLSSTAPLDVWRLAEHLDIPVIPLSGFHEAAPHAARLFLNGGEETFSGVTVFRGSNRTIVFNDAHVAGRQASDLGTSFRTDCCFTLLWRQSTGGVVVCGIVMSRQRRTGLAALCLCQRKPRFRSFGVACRSLRQRQVRCHPEDAPIPHKRDGCTSGVQRMRRN